MERNRAWRRIRLRRAVTVLVVASSVAAACSGSGSSAPEPTVPDPDSTSAVGPGPSTPMVAPQADAALAAVAAAVDLTAEENARAVVTRGVVTARVTVPHIVMGRSVFDHSRAYAVSADGVVELLDASDVPDTIETVDAEADDDAAIAVALRLLPRPAAGDVVVTPTWWAQTESLVPASLVTGLDTEAQRFEIVLRQPDLSPLVVRVHEPYSLGGRPGCSPSTPDEACVHVPDPDNERLLAGGALQTVGLQRLDVPTRLRGTHAVVYDADGAELRAFALGGPEPPVVSSPSGWSGRSDERFAAQNVYYWIDETAGLLSSLGFAGIPNDPIRVAPADPTLVDNAQSIAGVGLVFGETVGGVWTAEDAQIVIHEYGHALVDHNVGLLVTPEGGAYHEAIGDLLAALVTVRLGLRDPACVGPWFDQNIADDRGLFARVFTDPGCLRRVDDTGRYPEDLAGEPHRDSRYWSGAIWEVFLRELDSRGGSLDDCGEGSACRSTADDMLRTLTESWAWIGTRRFLMSEAAISFIKANDVLGHFSEGDVTDVFSERGLWADLDAPPVYATVRVDHDDVGALDWSLSVLDAGGSELCATSATMFSNLGFLYWSVDQCRGFLPPSPDTRWILEVSSPTETSEGTIHEFGIEQARRPYRSNACGASITGRAGDSVRLEIAETAVLPPGSLCAATDRADRSERIQAAYVSNGQLYEVDGGQPANGVVATDGAPFVGWVGLQRTMVVLENSRIRLWNPEDGIFANAACFECRTVVPVGGRLAGMTGDGQLAVFDALTLEPIRLLDVDLPDSSPGSFGSPVAMAGFGDEVFVLLPSPDGTSAYGGPQEVWAVGVESGLARFVFETGSNTAVHSWALAPDGHSLALAGVGSRGGFCLHFTRIRTLDLATGDSAELPFLVDPLDFEFGGEIHVADVFWNGDQLHAVLQLRFESPFGNGDCGSEWPSALYRLEGDRWEVVDSGPLTAVRPAGPGVGEKFVVVNGDDVYLERDGQGMLLADEGRLVATSGAAFSTDLDPPSPPAAVAATRDAILRLASIGDTAGLLALTSADFEASFGGSTVEELWADSAPFDEILTIFSGPSTASGDGFSWNDHPALGCRSHIDADGAWRWFLCGD